MLFIFGLFVTAALAVPAPAPKPPPVPPPAPTSGEHICKTANNGPGYYDNSGALQMQKLLATMSCDSNKPISINVSPDVLFALVCCVVK